MSRAIDADELMEHVYRDRLDSRELIAKMIENAPTIFAEPKPEFLKKFYETAYNQGFVDGCKIKKEEKKEKHILTEEEIKKEKEHHIWLMKMFKIWG